MPLSSVTITGDIADQLGSDFDARRTKVYVTTNIPDGTVIDTDGNKIRLGSGSVTLNADGTFSASVWVPGTGSNPASWQTYFHVDYPDAATRIRRTRTFGPFTVTAAADLADLVEQQEVPPTYLTTVTAQLDTYVTEAEAARDAAVDISNIAVPDDVVSTLIKGTAGAGPLTRSALTASIEAITDPIAADLAGEITDRQDAIEAEVLRARREAAAVAMPTLREQVRRLKAGNTPTWRNAESWNVRAMTKQGRRLIYVKQSDTVGCQVGYSDDDGATRPTSVKTFTPAATHAVAKSVLVTNDGEIVIVLSGLGSYDALIYRSTGFDSNPATATWALVFDTPVAESATAPLQQYGGLAYDGQDTVAGAWYDKKTNASGTIYGNDAGVRVRASTDKGVTWATVFNLRDWLIANGVPSPDSNTNGFHVHGIEYDPYSDGWVLSYGDTDGSTGECGILHFSKDFATVTTLYRGTGPWQAVGIVCLPDCILLGGDGGTGGGLNRITRKADGTFAATPEKAYQLTNGIGLGDNSPAPGQAVLWCHSQISGSTPLSRLLLTADGFTVHELLVDNTYTVSSTNGLQFVVGPTATGKVIASSANDGRYASASPASSWSEVSISPT